MPADDVEDALRFRLALEELVTSLSTRFLNLPSDDIPAAIGASLRELGAAFGVDRVYVVRSEDDPPGLGMFEEWWAEGVPHRTSPPTDLPIEAQRFWVRRLRAGELTHFATLEDVPADVPQVADALAADGVKSLLFLPLASRGRTDGFLGFEARRREYQWSPQAIALMRTVGEIFVSALDRARSEAALAAAARELAQRNADLERSNADLEAFASIASHDLKSPLRVVRGFLDLLERTSSDRLGEEGVSFVQAAQRGAARMEELIDDLLSYSMAGRAHLELEQVDLGRVLDEVLADNATLMADAGATVTAADLPTVTGDETQLRQLLQNLVTNAVKFVGPGVTPDVGVAAERIAAEWHIAITDNGIGISPDDRDRIFGMFTRLHGQEAYPGTGIGLAVCQRVVAAHGGRIWVDDAPSGGTRFTFTLPV